MTTTGLFFRVFNIILMIGIPLLAALLLFRKGPGTFRPLWIGALGFLLSQVGHLPFNRFVMLPGLRAVGVDLSAGEGYSLVILGLAAGLSAGLFEETARYLVFRWWLKGRGEGLLPVKYAVGHGGVESLLAGLLALAALIQVLVLGGGDPLEAFSVQEAAVIRQALQAYWAVPGGEALLGAAERISALLFHLGASLLVFKSVREKNIIWLGVAVLGHTVMNAFAIIGVKKLNLFLLEGLIFTLGLMWAYGGWRLRVRNEQLPAQNLPAPPSLSPPSRSITTNQLEESRYDE